MISAHGGLPAHRYTAQVTQKWPRGSKMASPEPRPRLGAVARRLGRVAPPPPLPMPMDGHRPSAVRAEATADPPPSPPLPPAEHLIALPTAQH